MYLSIVLSLSLSVSWYHLSVCLWNYESVHLYICFSTCPTMRTCIQSSKLPVQVSIDFSWFTSLGTYSIYSPFHPATNLYCSPFLYVLICIDLALAKYLLLLTYMIRSPKIHIPRSCNHIGSLTELVDAEPTLWSGFPTTDDFSPRHLGGGRHTAAVHFVPPGQGGNMRKSADRSGRPMIWLIDADRCK